MPESSNKRQKFTMHSLIQKITFKNVFKLIAIIIIVTVYTLLLGRMFIAKDRGVMNKYSPTEEFLAVSGKNTEILTQNINYTMDENGYYRISNLVYLPELGELQINVRYNNSTLDELKKYYPDADISDKPFCYELVDNNNNTYPLSGYIPKSNIIYNFRKLLFKNIDFENVERLYLDIKYIGDMSTDSPMSVRFTVFNSKDESHTSDLKVDNTNQYKFIK